MKGDRWGDTPDEKKKKKKEKTHGFSTHRVAITGDNTTPQLKTHNQNPNKRRETLRRRPPTPDHHPTAGETPTGSRGGSWGSSLDKPRERKLRGAKSASKKNSGEERDKKKDSQRKMAGKTVTPRRTQRRAAL